MWLLILFVHVGPMGSGNSNAITTASFGSQELCEAGGKAAADLPRGTVKEIRYVCIKQGIAK